MTQSQIEQQLSRMVHNGQFETIPDNILFTKMKELIKSIPAVKAMMVLHPDFIQEGEIYTFVGSEKNMKLINHNQMTISFPNGSHIRFCPTPDGIDITRVISNMKGDGTLLMSMVLAGYFDTLVKFNIPDNLTNVTLECTGSVGLGENQRIMKISDQCRFFRKFGFRKFGKYQPDHVKMKLELNEDFQAFFNKMRIVEQNQDIKDLF